MEISSEHLDSRTVKARERKFIAKFHLSLPVTCHVTTFFFWILFSPNYPLGQFGLVVAMSVPDWLCLSPSHAITWSVWGLSLVNPPSLLKVFFYFCLHYILGPSAEAFVALRAKRELIMLFWPILGHFWCPVVTLVTFSSNLSNFE